ncbi:MAG: cupin domain-containing protein [Nitriliruptor sp.]|nr:MAG: cupin domain-containing protein [Nitriliruptor sp.]
MTFVAKDQITEERFDWGLIGWRLTPAQGSSQLVVMDVTLDPGGGHDFHRHPDQEEMIIVREGRITQFLGQESMELGPGDSVFVPSGTVHASFNDGEETVRLTVMLGPAVNQETGYDLEDVADQEPWVSLRT